jgi:hypothetical protein
MEYPHEADLDDIKSALVVADALIEREKETRKLYNGPVKDTEGKGGE